MNEVKQGGTCTNGYSRPLIRLSGDIVLHLQNNLSDVFFLLLSCFLNFHE